MGVARLNPPDTYTSALAASVGVAGQESRVDPRSDEFGDIAAEGSDFLHQARGDKLVSVRGHQEHGLDIRVEPGNHGRHLDFVFEIRYRAQPAHDDARA